MNTKVLTLTIRNGRGETIAELALEPQVPANQNQRPTFVEGPSDAQRRMLFRLCARLGYEGDAARHYVDRRLGADPDKRAASRLIDDLQEELKRSNGGRDAGAA